MKYPASPVLAASALCLLAASPFLSSSCGDSTPPAVHAAEVPRHDGTFRLYDPLGRELLLRGVNARVEGLFDVTFSDGRIPLEPIPPFTEEDCRFLGEDLGLDHLRLPVNWSAIEPENDVFDEAYIDRILEVAAMCERHGVYTLVDFHQDGFSKEIGEDGAPLWAIVPAPTMLLQGPLHDLTERRLSDQVLAAFDTFNTNSAGGWDEFSEMAVHVARRVNGAPGVIGIEIFNEPYIFFRDGILIDFHRKVIDDVRAVAPSLALFFEPTSFRNITDFNAADIQIERENVVYSPHVYSDVFEDGWANEDTALVAFSINGARTEAETHRAALYVGEFGHDDSARGTLYVATTLELFDQNVASWAYWLYEEWSQGSWGLYDANESPPGRVALREGRADLLARAYPVAIAGHVASFHYDVATKRLEVSLEHATSGEHVLAAPMRTYPNGVRVLCDGAEVTAAFAAGRVRTTCRGSSLVLEPNP